MNKQKAEEFRVDQLNRFESENHDKHSISIDTDAELSNKFLTLRRSTRLFALNEIISFRMFSSFLLPFIADIRKPLPSYMYPSAGGLYPNNIYLFIKKDRVEGIPEGLYQLNPISQKLILINSKPRIDKNSHFYTNRDIFSTSAFSVYITYIGDVNMPKYNDLGYEFGLIEAGIILELMTNTAEEVGLGSCIIGEMNFENIQNEFNLQDNEVYIQSIELGLKQGENEK